MTRAHSLLFLTLGLAIFQGARAETAWERYVLHPTSSNARAVETLDYSASTTSTSDETDLGVLENQVLAGDREAVRLAFRALAVTTFIPLRKGLHLMLGRLARVNARIFLEELQRSGWKESLETVLGMTAGEEAYPDRTTARVYELRARAAALQEISVPTLIALRDECVAVLQRRASTLEALFNSASRSEVAILDAWYGRMLVRPCTRPGPDAHKFWNPTFDEVMAAERLLPSYLASARQCGTSLYPPKRYLRQYVGIVVAGRRLLYLNAFEAGNYAELKRLMPDVPNWKTRPYDMCHAGTNHWGIEYDVDKEAFSNLVCSYGDVPGRRKPAAR